jgi:hypothetical protein
MAMIFSTTITLLAPALSFTPRTRTQVSTMRIRNAGRLNQLPVS